MTNRPVLMIMLLGLVACAAGPHRGAETAGGRGELPGNPVPDPCKAAFEAAPSYTVADYSARLAERARAVTDGEQSPDLKIINRPAPQYPRCAVSFGLEGHCDMVFDVTPDGTTANLLPVCSSRLFERDAALAVSRWTFEPPGDGPRPAVINRLTFKFSDLDETPGPAVGGPVMPGPVPE